MILWQTAFHECFFRVKGHPNQLLNIQFSFCTARLRLEKGKTLAFICYPTEEHIQSFFLLFLRAWRPLSFTSHSLPVRISDVFTLQNPLIHTQPLFNLILKYGSFVTTTITYLVPCIHSCYQYASTSARNDTLTSSFRLHITWKLISVTC